MNVPPIRVLFVCKACRQQFEEVANFIEHKKEKHFNEFQYTTCIVFEESNNNHQLLSDIETAAAVITVKTEPEFDSSEILLPQSFNANPNHYINANLENASFGMDFFSQNFDLPNSDPLSSPFNDANISIQSAFNLTRTSTAGDFVISDSQEFILEPKLELVTLEKDENGQNTEIGVTNTTVNSPFNPYVLVSRLTAAEIQEAISHQREENHSIIIKCDPDNFLFDPNNVHEETNQVDDLDFDLDLSSQEFLSELSSSNLIPNFAETPPKSHRINSIDLECKLCNKILSSEAARILHVGTCILHHKNRDRFCFPCNKRFYDSSKLKIHNNSFHGTISDSEEGTKSGSHGPKKCHLCSKEFLDSRNFRYHLERHKNIQDQNRPFGCHMCSKSFFTKGLLNKHLCSHSNERPFKCDQPKCNKSYKTLGTLRLHVATSHADSKPFQCPHPGCNRAFSTNNGLSKHSIVHQESTRLTCPLPNCAVTLKNTDSLRGHFKTHFRDKFRNYICTEKNCPSAFLTAGSLSRHQRLVHKIFKGSEGS